MNTSLILLHAGMHGAPMAFGFFPGLLFSILAVVLIVKLLKHGRVGPVRFDPSRTATPGSPEAGSPGHRPGHRPGPPWAQAPFGRGPWGQPSPEEAALATLADRLAKGEISPEEYLERSTALRGATDTQEG